MFCNDHLGFVYDIAKGLPCNSLSRQLCEASGCDCHFSPVLQDTSITRQWNRYV